MQLSIEQLEHLHQTARAAARKAGEYIALHRPSTIETKEAGSSAASQVVTEVDRKSQEIILEVLALSIVEYNLGLLAEEQADDGSRLVKDYFWCIDPLDGTLPFIENREGYAVAIALIRQDGIPCIGVVYNPVSAQCYSALIGCGAWRNDAPLRVQKHPEHYLFHHRSLLKNAEFNTILAQAKDKFAPIDKETIKTCHHAGAIMNAIWTIEKAPSYYFALPKSTQGGGCIWDYAATVCIFNELDLQVSDYYGKQLHLNQPDSIYMNKYGVIFSTL